MPYLRGMTQRTEKTFDNETIYGIVFWCSFCYKCDIQTSLAISELTKPSLPMAPYSIYFSFCD